MEGKVKEKGKVWENLQNIAIIIAMIMGMKGKPTPGSPEEKRIPDWIISILPESFTLEDESWRKLIQSSCNDRRATKVENIFRKKLGEDPAGYDAGQYRKRLMHAKKEFLEQAKKPVVKNEEGARVSFEPITFRDPCNEFLNQLIAEVEAGGTPKKIYERQRKFAIGQNFLVEMGGVKKAFYWLRSHKAETLAGIILLPVGFFELLFWILS